MEQLRTGELASSLSCGNDLVDVVDGEAFFVQNSSEQAQTARSLEPSSRGQKLAFNRVLLGHEQLHRLYRDRFRHFRRVSVSEVDESEIRTETKSFVS